MSRGGPMLKRLAQRFPPESVLGHRLRIVWHRATPWVCRHRHPEIIAAFGATVSPVFFVQVGSNDSGGGDPLRGGIRRLRWRGLMIEPLPHVFARLQRRYRHRPDLILENVAIAEADGEQTFYSLRPSNEPDLPSWYDRLGSFSRENILRHADEIPDIETRIETCSVACRRLDGLLRDHGIQRVDLLHVDAEGFDARVLQLFDFASYTPSLVLYEHLHLSAVEQAECDALLARHGYACYRDLMDTVCVHRTRLADRGTPLARAWQRLPS